MSEHRNTEAGYCETWGDFHCCDTEAVEWPDHPWSGDDHGHNCTGCTEDSVWKCDSVAHGLGQVAREQAVG